MHTHVDDNLLIAFARSMCYLTLLGAVHKWLSSFSKLQICPTAFYSVILSYFYVLLILFKLSFEM